MASPVSNSRCKQWLASFTHWLAPIGARCIRPADVLLSLHGVHEEGSGVQLLPQHLCLQDSAFGPQEPS